MKHVYFTLFLVIHFSCAVFAQDNFRMKIRIATPNESFTIPTNVNETYNYDVRWSDPYQSGGITIITAFENGFTGDATHTYSEARDYIITIRGNFPRIYFNNSGDKYKIISIEQWGDNQWTSMQDAFYGCSNLEIKATDSPDLSQATSLGNMFKDCTTLDVSLANWNVSTITDMSGMLEGAKLSTANYDATLNNWVTQNLRSNVTFDAGYSTYCSSFLSRRFITDPTEFNWTITDGGEVCEEDKFITTWQTTSADESITIPTTASGYDYTIEWGDGTFTTGNTSDATHTYETAGSYTVKIYGDFPRIYFNNGGDKDKIITVEQWGTNSWSSFDRSFYGCINLDIPAADAPDLTLVEFIGSMFRRCTNLGSSSDLDFSNWDTSNIISFQSLFQDAPNFNSATITNWDVGNGRFFALMFAGATTFNQDISDWNIGERVIEGMGMPRMFINAFSFNQPVGKWDMSKVANILEMFKSARDFDQNLGEWDISSVTNATGFLQNAQLSTENYEATLTGGSTLSTGETRIPTGISFNGGNSNYCDSTSRDILTNTSYNWTITDGGIDCPEEEKFITTWTVTAGDLTIPIYMFGTSNNYTVDWGDGTVESGFTGDATHTYATAGTYTVKIFGDFSQLYFFNRDGKEKIRSIEQWGTNQWTGLDFSFYGCSNLELNADDVPDLSQATSIGAVFQNATAFTDANDKLKDWDVSTITDFAFAFQGTSFNRNISGWNMQEVEAIDFMFANNTVFNQPIGNWTFNNLKTASGVFQGASSFNQDLSNWNMSQVDLFELMFKDATAFDQSLGDWDISTMRFVNEMLQNSGISVANYDATLLGWETLDAGETQIPTGINFNSNTVQYCTSAFARNQLDTIYSWDFTDGGQACAEEDKFITTWETTGNNEDIQIRTSGSGFNYIIEWGDGVVQTDRIGNSSHTFASPGVYTVKILGAFPRLYTNNFTSIGNKMRSVEQWGTGQWISFDRAFEGAGNLVINATDIPNLSNVTNMFEAFKDCKKLVDNGGQMQHWDVSKVENFTSAFQGANVFNVDLGQWDLSSAQSMNNMLNGTGLSIANYDTTLQGWANNPDTPNDQSFGASGLQYCLAETARNILDVNKNWSINDAGVGCATTDFFITTWQTTTVNQSVTIPTTGTGYNYTIDWGDGSFEDTITGNITHIYIKAGTYKIRISGDFPRIYFNNSGDKDKITSIDQWGTQQWVSMASAFYGCSMLELNVSDTPDLSQATSLERMFMGTNSIVDNEASVNSWDTSTITDMSHTFADSIFDFDITSWDVGNVTNFFRMFDGNTEFNQNINGWNIGENVTGTINMSAMFKDTQRFNQSIGSWNVSKVNSMNGMFSETRAFNQSLENWDVSNVREFISMFESAEAFDQSLSTWDLSSATNMNDMFKNSELSLANYDATLIGWATDTSGNTMDGVDDIPVGINFHAGNSTYCQAGTARSTLTGTSYNWTINDGGVVLSCTIVVAPVVYLQGAFTNPYSGQETLMRDDLHRDDLIPRMSPYTDGISLDPGIFSVLDQNALVDWIWIELRDSNDRNTIVASRSALLQRDGDVLDENYQPLAFNLAQGDYYLVIQHRNHLGLMTDATITLSDTTTTINFSDNSTTILGGSNAMVDMGNDVFAMISGDYNENGQIQNSDVNEVIQLLGGSGYNHADMDMNGQIQNTDINNLLNTNIGKGQQF